MDWKSQVAKNLHQAELEMAPLEKSICLIKSELKRLQQNQSEANAQIDAEIAALQTKRRQFDYQMSCQISDLWSLEKKRGKELQTVERIIALTKERQGLGQPRDPRLFPKEVLDRILEYLLVNEEVVHISRRYQRGFEKRYNIAVFQCCRLMKENAYRIFFGNNYFEINMTGFNPRFFHPTVSAYLRSVKVNINNTTNIPECLQAIQRCVELRRLSIQISTGLTYRGSEKPTTFTSLKFKKPSMLTRVQVDVELPSSRDSPSTGQNEICKILKNVLENGKYVSKEKKHAPPDMGNRRSKRVKVAHLKL